MRVGFFIGINLFKGFWVVKELTGNRRVRLEQL